jgi:hypothetical protein
MNDGRGLTGRVDQMPAWAFVAGAVVVFGAVRASRLFALLHQSRGGMELAGLITLAVFLGVLIFAVRRRQVSAWRSTLHVVGSVVAGNALGIVMVWPFIPDSYSLSLLPMVRDTAASGAVIAVLSLPIAVAMLWLSRRYGSHSGVTERRSRVIQEQLRKRFARAQAGDAERGVSG